MHPQSSAVARFVCCVMCWNNLSRDAAGILINWASVWVETVQCRLSFQPKCQPPTPKSCHEASTYYRTWRNVVPVHPKVLIWCNKSVQISIPEVGNLQNYGSLLVAIGCWPKLDKSCKTNNQLWCLDWCHSAKAKIVAKAYTIWKTWIGEDCVARRQMLLTFDIADSLSGH